MGTEFPCTSCLDRGGTYRERRLVQQHVHACVHVLKRWNAAAHAIHASTHNACAPAAPRESWKGEGYVLSLEREGGN